MPSPAHETLVLLLQQHPELLDTLLRALGQPGLPPEVVVVKLTQAEAERLLTAGPPELAVFAAWAVHDQVGRKAKSVVRRAVHRVETAADPQLRDTLERAMMSMLDGPLLAVIRERMMNAIAFPETEGAKALRREIEAIGEERGKAIGEERGRAIGEERGRAIGEASALLEVLKARGFTIDESTRQRVGNCQDLSVLTSWIARAVTAPTLAEVFAAGCEG